MPLVDLVALSNAGPAASGPPLESWEHPVACPRYRPLPGSLRCEHYVAVGGCELLDIMTCSEWSGAGTGTDPPSPANVSSLPAAQLALAEGWASSPAAAPRPAADREPRQPPRQGPPPTVASPTKGEPVIGLRPEDLASFKALGVEVCIHSPTLGDVWLVPAYTNERRREIIPEHAATLAAIVAAFPGAQPSQWITRSR
jgi:hypothetical protein